MNPLSPNDKQLLAEGLQAILSELEEYSFVKDVDFVYHAASEAFVEMCGKTSADDIIGKTDYDLFPKAIADAYRADDQRMLAMGKALPGYVEKLPAKDGHPHWAKTWKNLIRNEQGRVIGMYGRGRDITNEVNLETEVTTSRRFRKLIEQVPAGLGIQHEHNGEFFLDFINESWCRIHHFSMEYAQQLLYKNTQDFIYPPDLDAVKEEFVLVNSGVKQKGHSVYRIYGEDKQLHWIEINYSSAYEENGIRYYYAAYTNLDAQKEAEEQLHSYLEKAKEEEINRYRQSVQNLLAANPNSLCTFYFNITQNTSAPGFGRSPYITKMLTADTVDGVVENFLEAVPDAAQKQMVNNFLNRQKMLENFEKGLVTRSFECQRKDETGDYIWVRSYGNLFQNPISKDVEGIIYSVDIDWDKNWELILDVLVGKDYDFVALLDLHTNTVTEYSEKGKSHFASSRLFRVDYTQAMIEAVSSFIREDKLDEALKAHSIDAIKAHLETNPVYYLTFPTKNNREEAWRISYLKDSSDKILIARKDITEVMELEQKHITEMREAKQAAEKANKAKSEFLSRMSHDIRTPLNGIIGMTYLTRDMDLPQEAKENLSKIDNSSKFLLSLINDVLDMSKAESGKIELHMEPYTAEDFHAYIDSVIVPLCKRRNQTCSFEIASFVDDLVPIFDKLRVNQVVFNLLSNSSKYTPEGGKIVYRITENRLPGNRMHMHVDIIDNGIGMSDEFQKVIFEPFTQENEQDKAEMQGTGLGMAIVKKLMDIMNGTVTVTSQIGVGTTFGLDFDLDCVPVADVPVKKNTEILNGGDKATLEGKHVLVCEDHPLNREIIELLLQKMGMVVTTAENGQEGVREFANSPVNYFDAILMDIRMPVMDGNETAKVIRAIPRSDADSIAIIGLSANAFVEDIELAKASGMDAYLSKPINPKDLYATLMKYIN